MLRGRIGGNGAGAPSFEGDEESKRGDDAAEDLERRLEREVGDREAGEDRGHRQRSVGDDVVGGEDGGSVLGRDLADESPQATEEGCTEARASDDRTGEVALGRPGRGGNDDEADPG